MVPDDKSHQIRDAADAVKGLVEAVPVYQDVLQPAAKEIGKGLATVAKTIHVVLAPVAGLVWGYEKMSDYLSEALSKRLKDVPPERIVTPQLTIAGPALDAMRYAGPDPELRELYANILARAMDAKTAHQAHPAFVEILKQITPDEARILRLVAEHDTFPLVSVRSAQSDGSYVWILHHFGLLGEQAGCAVPGLAGTYLDNLSRLGIVVIDEDRRDAAPNAYDPLHAHPAVQEAVNLAGGEGRTSMGIDDELLMVTELGRQFCDAVVKALP